MGPVVETQARRLPRQVGRRWVGCAALAVLWPRGKRRRLSGALLLLVLVLLQLWGGLPLDGCYSILLCVLGGDGRLSGLLAAAESDQAVRVGGQPPQVSVVLVGEEDTNLPR